MKQIITDSSIGETALEIASNHSAELKERAVEVMSSYSSTHGQIATQLADVKSKLMRLTSPKLTLRRVVTGRWNLRKSLIKNIRSSTDSVQFIKESIEKEGIPQLRKDNEILGEMAISAKDHMQRLNALLPELRKEISKVEKALKKEEDAVRKTELANTLEMAQLRLHDATALSEVFRQFIIMSNQMMADNLRVIATAKRVLGVTVVSLTAGVMIRAGLNNQQKMREAISSIKRLNGSLIRDNAKTFSEQSKAVNRAEASIDIEALKEAERQISETLNEIKSAALENVDALKNGIEEFDKWRMTVISRS